MENSQNLDLTHHKRHEYCTNRLNYRNGRKLTAIKTYTIINESRHLLVFGVPRVNLYQEVKHLFAKYGRLSNVNLITDGLKANKTVEIELFTDCYYVAYEKIHQARNAKAMIDRKNFYGGVLHVSYAPEYETVDDLKQKFAARKKDVRFRLRRNK